jgi:hypothetical protein
VPVELLIQQSKLQAEQSKLPTPGTHTHHCTGRSCGSSDLTGIVMCSRTC